jgi:hypothetical protein
LLSSAVVEMAMKRKESAKAGCGAQYCVFDLSIA